jgi:hypothetical protein
MPSRPDPDPPTERPATAQAGRVAVVLLALLAAWSFTIGLAQSEWQIDVLIPDAISVRVPTQAIAFGLTHADYPPAAYPARYPATVPDAPPGQLHPLSGLLLLAGLGNYFL